MKKSIYRLIILLIGNALLALGVSAFITQTDLIMGGGTGIGLALHHFFGIDMSLAVLIINIAMFLLGFICLGKQFAMLTIVSTIVYPFFLKCFEMILEIYPQNFDIFTSSIFGAVFIGLGIGLVLKEGASTGGMDIPPIILNKKLGIPTSVLIYMFDFIIILSQAFSIDLQTLLYSFIVLFVSTVTIDKTMTLGSTQTQVFIISPKYLEINEWILNHMDRGTTFVEITTGLKRTEQKAVLCILSKRELHTLSQGIQEIDKNAFTIISDVHEVHGRGFSLPKIKAK